ncbi:MAG: LolA family protein [bacterium]
MRALAFPISFILALMWAMPLSAITGDEVVANMQREESKVNTIRISFDQTMTVSGETQSMEGRVTYSRILKAARWDNVVETETSRVEQTFILKEGRANLWSFIAGDNRVVKQRMDEENNTQYRQLLNGFIQSIDEIKRNFRVKLLREEEYLGRKHYVLELDALEGNERQIVWVDGSTWKRSKVEIYGGEEGEFILELLFADYTRVAGYWMFKELAMKDMLGNSSVIRVKNIELNPDLPPGIFEYTPPPGATVVEG